MPSRYWPKKKTFLQRDFLFIGFAEDSHFFNAQRITLYRKWQSSMSPSDSGLENIRNVYLLTLHELLYCTCYAVLKSSRNGCNTLCPSFSPLSLLLSPSPTHSLAHCWHSFMYFPRNYIIVAMLFLPIYCKSLFELFSYFLFLLLLLTSLLTHFNQSSTHTSVRSPTCSLPCSLFHSHIHSLTLLAHSLTQSLIPSFTYSLNHSFIHPLTQSLTLFISISARLSPTLSSLFLLCIL